MKKAILILLVMLTALSCETAEEKQARLFYDQVFESNYLQTQFKNYTTVSLNITSAQNGYINKNQYITDYNNTLGFALGYTNNLDSIEAYLKRKGNLYQKYMVTDAFYHHRKDSLQELKYRTEKDSILQLLKTL